MEPAFTHSPRQRPDDVFLPEEIGGRLRPVTAVERLVLRVLSHSNPLDNDERPCTRHRHRKTRSLLRAAGSGQANLRHPPETA